jgi:hypothetical protein
MPNLSSWTITAPQVSKQDYEIAAKSFTQYCNKNIIGEMESFQIENLASIANGGIPQDIVNKAADIKSKRIAIYFSCSREVPNQSSKRKALQKMVKKSRILSSSVEEYSELTPEWRQKVSDYIMTEEEIEKMFKDYQPNNQPNEFVKKNNAKYTKTLRKENKVAENFTDWLGELVVTDTDVKIKRAY